MFGAPTSGAHFPTFETSHAAVHRLTPSTGNPCGVFVSSTHDIRQVALVATGSIGGRVTAVGAMIIDGDRIPTNQGKSVTITFTTQTRLLTGHTATVLSSLFSPGTPQIFTPPGSPASPFSGVAAQSGGLVFTVGAATIPLGQISVIVSGINVGPPSIMTTTSATTTTDSGFSSNTGRLGGNYPATPSPL